MPFSKTFVDQPSTTFDNTAPVTQASGDTATSGTSTVSARRDHKHGMPSIFSQLRWAISTTFEASARFATAIISGGTNTFGANGIDQACSASSGSSADCKFNINGNSGGASKAAWLGSPMFSSMVRILSAAGGVGANGSAYIGLGSPTVAAAGHTYTVRHIGFKLIKTDGVTVLNATQADGTTENASASLEGTIATDNQLEDLILKVNGTTSVDYYTRKNIGSLSAATNLTTNFPNTSGSDNEELQTSISNNNTAFQFEILTSSFYYER